MKITEILIENTQALESTYVDMNTLKLQSFKAVDTNKTLLFAFSNFEKGIMPLTVKYIPAQYFTGPDSATIIERLRQEFGQPDSIYLSGTGTISATVKSYNDLADKSLSVGTALVQFRSPANPYSGEPNIRIEDIANLSDKKIVNICKSVLSGSINSIPIKVEVHDPDSDSFFNLTKLISFNQDPVRKQKQQTPRQTKRTSPNYKEDFDRGMEYAEEGEFEQAINFFNKAAEAAVTNKDDSVAGRSYYAVGLCYYNLQDFENAAAAWSEAASYENVDANKGLGILFSQGQGVEQDNEKAVEYYLKAALEGDAQAAFNAANIFADDRIPNPTFAYILYSMAADLGDEEAEQIKDEMLDGNSRFADEKYLTKMKKMLISIFLENDL